MKLETERLILRRWEDSDAEDLYKYASNPDVGPIAGWPAHQSVDESRDVIKNVLSGEEAYAICLKEDGKTIGAIELKLNGHTDMTDRDDECEMGYWLGKPFWGQGIMPEAVMEMLRHAFEELEMQKVWIGYYEGNTKSKRVQEKCGFRYQWRSEDVDVPLMHEKRTGHVSLMTKEDWLLMQRGIVTDYSIRKVTIDDYDAIFDLWNSTEQSRRALNPVDDTREGIAKYLNRNPNTCFATVKDNKIIGVILTGHDGRRAIIHHMCVHPDYRRRGIAGHLVALAEDALKKEGIQKIFGLVFKDNEAANAFWEREGYSLRTNLNYRNKSVNDEIPAGE